jgi:hypothetical protein
VIFMLSIMAIIFLSFFGLSWLTSTKSYRAWAMRDAQRAEEERESRPKPPWADDPIAKSIEWTGTAAWGADPSPNPKGAMVRIGSVTSSRIEFQPTSARAVYGRAVFYGAAGFVLILSATGSFLTALLAPIICFGFGALIWLARLLTCESLVFDKHLGMYWRGKSPPNPAPGARSSEQHGRISDIYALQLISTRRFVGDPRMGAGSDHKEFPTHELNLVLKDGTRLSTVCLDDYASLDHDAKILAAFLQRPLWYPR